MKKRTLILGATDNPSRYANLAANRLVSHGHPIVNIGIKSGQAGGVEIEKAGQVYEDIDTITLYVGPHNQPQYYDYIIESKPKRIIFNPGTENPVLEELAEQNGIETLEACTLVMLSTGQY
ncbi:MAG: CoA-binding protein [Daejeonella sp.]|uniref:CoA-binding protein n=1 Tax=Daejeonella sp. JGW-45 TaxID=3034148 RepID=UPI0023EAD07D|nr:CoA-binding protein [Daejeonella sp. JGW-45]